ncbi:MAG TPA: potassium-transporting ATPase subunit KdpC [Bryobacteraceae bacterium]|nr:potassium-transporting ATPase subunit KdpC [Bryobacteraceae bacterium]
MFQQLLPGFRMTLLMTVLTGLLYPGLVTGLCQLLFRDQANGSLKIVNGQAVGSTLIGQPFAKPEYFHPRPSAAGNGYDGLASGGSNFGPTNTKLADRVKTDAAAFRKDNPGYQGNLPADLVTASGSGLDPHISPASAEAQAQRVAQARGVTVAQIEEMIAGATEGRDLGILGEPRVNVLLLNLTLDRDLKR